MLGDIVTAQEMDKEQAASKADKHELDKKYGTLKADLQLVAKNDKDYKVYSDCCLN